MSRIDEETANSGTGPFVFDVAMARELGWTLEQIRMVDTMHYAFALGAINWQKQHAKEDAVKAKEVRSLLALFKRSARGGQTKP